MTTPDPTPYLLPTDLVTAADVARWLKERAEDEPRSTAWYLHERLTARLDRERRQACRRGALERWRRVRELVRWAACYDMPGRQADWAWREVARPLAHALSDVLAFRAAARQP